MASSAASLSPTTAALLRASPNSRPHHNHSHSHSHSHSHHQNHQSYSSLQQRPSPLLASTTPRSSPRQTENSQQQQQQQHSADSGSCSSPEIEQLRTTFKRQTVDAGTQYSRPSTPSDTAAAGESSRMPGTAIGTKRSPPDAAKVIAAPGPASAPAPSKNTPSQQQQQQRQQQQQQKQQLLLIRQQQQQQQQLPQQQQQSRQQSQRRQQLDDDDRPPEGSASKRLRPAKPPVKLLPRRYEAADPRDLVVLISSMIMELIRFNDQIPLRDGRLTRFHSRSPPRISVQDYLQRLTTHATLSPPILLSMVYYIDRLCALYPAFTISSLTVHRFLISSATVASKGLSDSFWTNKTYARVGGISVEELALLELEFLWRVEWRIVPQPEVLVDYYLSLVERCDDYEMQPELPPPIPPLVTAAGGARSIRAPPPAAAPAAVPPAPASAPAPAVSSAPADSQPKSHVKPEPSTTTEKTEPDSAQSTSSSST
ncbi:hypothetical protein H109_01228 [Trichophyton interdigitale MR816]|uniref:Cyclin-dependent protein kinase regulator Pho80 n=1 Tax=Trichophyton interdigitale (strain MR816) TaxID=1215338 RepID=A0A059JGH2_TRIIM|nr:hypothetical protein H101_05990 [Trichophyton interdigitale H6]KDB26991.1 hypothetical protein H109_01228 [Trichophyton interdigitale MR816]